MIGAATLAALLAALGSAPDPPPSARWELRWVLGPNTLGCPEAGAFAAAVEQALARPVFAASGEGGLAVLGRVDRGPPWYASVQLADREGRAKGSREVTSEADTCDDLAKTLALVVALMIDPQAEVALSAPPPSPPVEPAAVPRWEIHAGAGPAGGVGIAPDPSVGLRLDLWMEPPRAWSLELFATGWLPSTISTGGRGSLIAVVSVGAVTCPVEGRWDRTRAAACAGVQVGLLHASGFGFDEGYQSWQPLVDLVVRGRLSRHLSSRVWIHAGGHLSAGLLRAQLVYQAADGTSQSLYPMPPAAMTGEVGLDVELL